MDLDLDIELIAYAVTNTTIAIFHLGGASKVLFKSGKVNQVSKPVAFS